MDTDQLTQMAYGCLGLADDASDCLKTEIGAACSEFRDEDEYLEGMLEYVTEIEAEPESFLDEWDLADDTDLRSFMQKLRVLREYIQKTIATPIGQRGENGVVKTANADTSLKSTVGCQH